MNFKYSEGISNATKFDTLTCLSCRLAWCSVILNHILFIHKAQIRNKYSCNFSKFCNIIGSVGHGIIYIFVKHIVPAFLSVTGLHVNDEDVSTMFCLLSSLLLVLIALQYIQSVNCNFHLAAQKYPRTNPAVKASEASQGFCRQVSVNTLLRVC